jgi:hypothetical protein
MKIMPSTVMNFAGSQSRVICLQGESVQKRNSALDQCPEQSLNYVLEIRNVRLQHLQLLLLAHDFLLLERLGDKRPLAATRRRDLL